MTRGTTPIIVFRFTSDYSGSDDIQLTFSQNGCKVIVFDKADMTYSTDTVGETTYYTAQVTFTQEQANLFSVKAFAEAQFRFKIGSAVQSTEIKRIDISRILNDEVL